MRKHFPTGASGWAVRKGRRPAGAAKNHLKRRGRPRGAPKGRALVYHYRISQKFGLFFCFSFPFCLFGKCLCFGLVHFNLIFRRGGRSECTPFHLISYAVKSSKLQQMLHYSSHFKQSLVRKHLKMQRKELVRIRRLNTKSSRAHTKCKIRPKSFWHWFATLISQYLSLRKKGIDGC